MSETVYFQPPDINPKYCEVGMIMDSDPDHIWYINEPCKVLIKDVKLIDRENVTYDKKKGLHIVNQSKNS